MKIIYRTVLKRIAENFNSKGWHSTSIGSDGLLRLEKRKAAATCELRFWLLSELGKFENSGLCSFQGDCSFIAKDVEAYLQQLSAGSYLSDQSGRTVLFSLARMAPGKVGQHGLVLDPRNDLNEDLSVFVKVMDERVEVILSSIGDGTAFVNGFSQDSGVMSDLVDWTIRRMVWLRKSTGTISSSEMERLRNEVMSDLEIRYSKLEKAFGIPARDSLSRDSLRLDDAIKLMKSTPA